MATELDQIRDLADAVRDLAAAQDHARLDREAMRGEGQLRGEMVSGQVKAHHDASMLAIGELRADAKALAVDVRAAMAIRQGAPWWLVAVLIAALLSQAAVVLHLYAQANGQDAGAAFDDATKIVPDVPGVTVGGDGGTTPVSEPEPE